MILNHAVFFKWMYQCSFKKASSILVKIDFPTEMRKSSSFAYREDAADGAAEQGNRPREWSTQHMGGQEAVLEKEGKCPGLGAGRMVKLLLPNFLSLLAKTCHCRALLPFASPCYCLLSSALSPVTDRQLQPALLAPVLPNRGPQYPQMIQTWSQILTFSEPSKFFFSPTYHFY